MTDVKLFLNPTAGECPVVAMIAHSDEDALQLFAPNNNWHQIFVNARLCVNDSLWITLESSEEADNEEEENVDPEVMPSGALYGSYGRRVYVPPPGQISLCHFRSEDVSLRLSTIQNKNTARVEIDSDRAHVFTQTF